jgi:hypothetical protein
VAAEATELRRASPTDRQAVGTLSTALHEHRFDYPAAFAVAEEWLAAHPDDQDFQEAFTEAHITTGRFDQALRRLADHLQHRERSALRALEVVALVGAGRTAEAKQRVPPLATLLAAQPERYQVGWNCGGVRHFVGTDPRFAQDRPWLLELLDAMEQKDRTAITRAMAPVLRRLAPQANCSPCGKRDASLRPPRGYCGSRASITTLLTGNVTASCFAQIA